MSETKDLATYPAATVIGGFYYYSPWAFCTESFPEVATAIFDATWYAATGNVEVTVEVSTDEEE